MLSRSQLMIRSRGTSVLRLLAATGLLVWAGCGSSTSPIMDPIVFEGEIGKDGRESHSLVLTDDGTIHLEFTRLEEKPMEGVVPIVRDWILGIGIGRPGGEDCSTTYTVAARVGDLVVLGLNAAEYCLLIFDNGALPDETIIEYSVRVSPAS